MTHIVSDRASIIRRAVTVVIAAAMVAGLSVIGAPIGARAGELEDLQKEFGVLDPQQADKLLDQCNAEEESALRDSRSTEERAKLRANLEYATSEVKKADREIADLEERLGKLADEQKESSGTNQLHLRMLEDRDMARARRDYYKDQETQLRATLQAAEAAPARAAPAERAKLRANLEYATSEVKKADREVADLEERLRKLADEQKESAGTHQLRLRMLEDRDMSRARRDHYKDQETRLRATLQAAEDAPARANEVAARCKRLETLKKLAPLVAPGEPDTRAQEEAGKANEALAKGTIDDAAEAARQLAARAGEDDPRVKELNARISNAIARDAEANRNIADARRVYEEARLQDVEGDPGQAAEAYKVAQSLLADARDMALTAERKEKLQQAIARVTQRIADLPEIQKSTGEMSSAEATAFCASKLTNSVVLRTDPTEGAIWCGCKAGDVLNSSETACVKGDTRALARASCSKSFPGSVPVGLKNGVPMCNCPRGRGWNEARSACVRVTVTREPSAAEVEATNRAAYELGALLGRVLRSQPRGLPPGCHYRRDGTGGIDCGSN